ncbi:MULTISPECIES: lipopolysaccharide assembly protein LapA domain-containing protein [Devosia]|uniref:Lipopolysaccharide assembly protein A domain-containing protein n=1 Tax=Devosia equisanguinis TaxID=2490941 RepID=A0A447I784_9HYPH|nr:MULTISPECIES: lipopolysaccharide assembly protein LapA domain-containing protein [Devosia]ODT48716.1 MAG: hypothetical protein ABS74_11245 [Pelagibacterium sp. SCN 63-126]ODU85828.1 MAG: hypothetical protein ABT14_11290 [Pelagibacterium sp. SCN 63-17]OJX42005.1 MAG: hypothetical protein BGO80_10655 [Devosia sp. 63-57]VDS03372.1 hypothetical protein DEVEQU_00494 [Devosia equisanguinis]
MVKKIIGWLVLVPLCLALIAFALANRHLVAVNLNPFAAPAQLDPATGYGIPLFVVLYIVLLIGVLMGGIATWFAQSEHRRRERHWRKETQILTTEVETLRRRSGERPASPANDLDDLLELR